VRRRGGSDALGGETGGAWLACEVPLDDALDCLDVIPVAFDPKKIVNDRVGLLLRNVPSDNLAERF
jgi:hypothetical protein